MGTGRKLLEQTPSEKLELWLTQFSEDEQEEIIRYALDHVLPDLRRSAAIDHHLKGEPEALQAAAPATPSATWRKIGEPDPHGNRYDCERAALALGKLTDDELANGAFMNYDVRPPLQDIIDGKAYSPIAWMTAVKDRIRWLSRSLEKALAATPPKGEPQAAAQPVEALTWQPKPATNVVPGKVACAKCGFSLIRTNLYVNSGTTGPGDERIEPCPNDGNPLLPVTWEAEARDAWKALELWCNRAIAAEKELAAATPPKGESTTPAELRTQAWMKVAVESGNWLPDRQGMPRRTASATRQAATLPPSPQPEERKALVEATWPTCRHGVRHPHECRECAEAAWEAHQARIASQARDSKQ